MLSFREQVEDLKKQAHIENGKSYERKAKVVANEILQEALNKLREKENELILDIKGIGVRLIPSNYTSVCIDYLDYPNFFHFTLTVMECDNKEHALQVFNAIKDILVEENLRMEHELSESFEAFF